MTLKSAAGSITIDGVIGSTNDIGNLAINDGLTGAGAITLNGVGDVSTPKIGITGTVDIGHTNTASVTLNGTAYNIDGDTTITTTTAADKIIIGGAMTIKTAGDKVEFVGGGITLNDGKDLTITAGAGNVTLTDIGATSSEVIDIEGATVTAAVIGNADEIKSVKLDGSTKVILGGNITTSNTTGNNVDIDGATELAAATVTINTSANNGTINFNSSINSDSGNARNLVLKAKGGNITVTGKIGVTDGLGTLAINDDYGSGTGVIALGGIGDSTNIGVDSTADIGHTGTKGIDLSGGYYNIGGVTTFTTAANDGSGNTDIIDFEAATTLKTSSDNISFVGGGISAAADGANITITTGGTTDGDVTLTAITVHSLEDVSVTGQNISASTIGDSTNPANVVGLTGVITLAGDITTDDDGASPSPQAGDVTLTGAVKINADTVIDTSAGNGAVEFTSTLNGADATNRALTVKSGSGKVTVTGVTAVSYTHLTLPTKRIV